MLGDERRFDPIGDGETLPMDRVGIALRLATVGTGDAGISATDDVEVVTLMDDCVRLATAGGTTLDFVVVVPLLADVGMTVGRRIPPFEGLSVFGGGAGGGGDEPLVG